MLSRDVLGLSTTMISVLSGRARRVGSRGREKPPPSSVVREWLSVVEKKVGVIESRNM